MTRLGPKLCQPSATAFTTLTSRVDRLARPAAPALPPKRSLISAPSPAAWQKVTAIGSQIVATPTLVTPRSISAGCRIEGAVAGNAAARIVPDIGDARPAVPGFAARTASAWSMPASASSIGIAVCSRMREELAAELFGQRVALRPCRRRSRPACGVPISGTSAAMKPWMTEIDRMPSLALQRLDAVDEGAHRLAAGRQHVRSCGSRRSR